jgi:hypothetical protein
MAVKRVASDWRKGSKRHMIAELAEQGNTKRQTFSMLKPLVESQIRPMVFSANVGGARRAKPMSEQLIELKNEIGRVYAILGRATSPDFDSDETAPDETPDVPPSDDDSDDESDSDETDDADDDLPADETEEPESADESVTGTAPTAKGKHRVKDELAYFLQRARDTREFCRKRAEMSEPLDNISMRPAQAAAKLIPAGIPADALLSAMTIHWPADARNDAGIADYDYVKLSRQIMEEREIDPDGKHELFGYVLTLAEERIPVWLCGPAGSGKSFIARQIADYLEVNYGETPMTPGATRGDLLGRLTANPQRPFILSQFCEIYASGGLFNFEEIDASDPSMLIVLNNALAGSHLYNSANGEMYVKSDDFIPFSTANTWGLGANRDYTARERLDAATIDRWRMGRVFVPVDESVEEAILFNRI